MKVTEKDVLNVADLANLELTEEERARLLRDLNSILDHIERLNRLDTTNVTPMAQVSERGAGQQDTARFEHAMRSDALGTCLTRDAALGNAPETDGTFFKVPKVIEK